MMYGRVLVVDLINSLVEFDQERWLMRWKIVEFDFGEISFKSPYTQILGKRRKRKKEPGVEVETEVEDSSRHVTTCSLAINILSSPS